ncbi:MAG TPA: sulfotransferase, partial [Pseudomonadales bacterium]|nr:sulfotransferase [Pseudomonadales bacterium]
YSRLDRMIHGLAFSTKTAQIALADMEDRSYASQLKDISAENAVFVTSLPRAGTTLLLETLEASSEFCSHTYRDMPFLLMPLFWSKMASRFHQESAPQERAHGDGMLVSVDSPEAFEEIIWATFWKEQYGKETVTPWDPRLKHEEFEHFLKQHFKKIILLRHANPSQGRYLSKNNMNIARLSYLAKTLPQASLIVPFRKPLQHAASLLKQHQNFLAIHKEDPFARKYMRDIGHYDFGENLKPINFNDWREKYPQLIPTQLEFWLRYWLEGYTHIQSNLRPSISLFSYDLFCSHPESSLSALADKINLSDRSVVLSKAQRAAPPKEHAVDVSGITPSLIEQADACFHELVRQALNANT